MSCKRCEDIHTAQKAGKTNEECKCGCHKEWDTTTSGNILFNAVNTGGATLTLGDNATTAFTMQDDGNWLGTTTTFNLNCACVCGDTCTCASNCTCEKDGCNC